MLLERTVSAIVLVLSCGAASCSLLLPPVSETYGPGQDAAPDGLADAEGGPDLDTGVDGDAFQDAETAWDADAEPDGDGAPEADVDASPSCEPSDCPGWWCDETTGRCLHHPSCDDIYSAEPTAPSGAYGIDLDGPGGREPFAVYCAMVPGGRGWILLMKLDGSLDTFHYDSAYWTDDRLLNEGSLDFSETEAKLEGFGSIPFTRLRIGMLHRGELRWIHVPIEATSMHALMNGGFTATDRGRERWLSLIEESALLPHCDLEGINVTSSPWSVAARIGVLTNNEMDCDTCDGWLGFGGRAFGACGFSFDVTVGNGVACSDGTDRNTAVFGYVMVR